MSNINIPRYCNGNLVYDEIPMNSIITTSKDGTTLSRINISGGVLNTYKFDETTLVTSNADPSFTDKLVLNNCEIVDESNQRINKNYLIYGNSSKHGLSPIELDTPSNNYEYYYIVNDKNNNVNVSTASQIYTNLYDKITKEGNSQELFSAIPICNSTDNQHLSLSLIIPQYYNNGNYYIKSDGSYFSLETIYGSILPSSLKTYTKDFNYSNNKILTIGKNNFNEDVFIQIQSSTSLKKPYLSGTGWGDLTYTTFLNSNNLSITKSLIYSNPVVIGTNGSMYGVILPENKKYVLTKSSFKELQITGSDISINDTKKINLKNIIQIKNDSKLYKLEDTTLSSGILHTTIDGDINISLLTNNDIQDNTITGNKIALNTLSGSKIISNTITGDKIAGNTITGDKIALTTITNNNIKDKTITNGKIADNTITGDKIADNTITGGKLFFNDNSQQSWSNIIIDQDNNLYRKYGDFFKNSNYYGVFDYNGNIQSLCANIITEGTMNGDRITNKTLQYNKLNISNDDPASVWSIIAVNSNNNFIKFSNTLSLNNQYGIFDNKGNIVQLTANKISGKISDMIANGSIGSNHLANSSVTTDKIKDNAVTTEKIKDNAVTMNKIDQGAVGVTQIANNSITSSKLNINGSEPLGTWKNLLINDNKFVTTDARVTNYGIFNNKGGVQELTGKLLNDIGFNLGIPDGEENEFNQIFVSADCIFYTSTIKDNYVNTNYIKVYNYFNGNNSSNKIIYINNPDQFVDTYSNISNTYDAFYDISNNSNISDINEYSIKLKTSLYIKNIEFDLRNITDYVHKENDTFNPLEKSFFQSSILIVGVYTSLCKLQTPTQVIMLPNNLFRYVDNSNYCESALLGYIPIDVSTVNINSLNNIIIDKTFDFVSTVNKGNIKYNNSFNDIKDDLLYFVPMYYINNNDNTVRELFYYNKYLTNSKQYASKFYTNIYLNNDNQLILTYKGDGTTIISSNDFTINEDNSIKITNLDYYRINWTNDRRQFFISDTNNVFLDLSLINPYELISFNIDETELTLKYFINEPIEKNIKFNISPITNRSNIIYTTLNSKKNELKKDIKYKFSLCSVNLSYTKNTGQYPAIIQLS